MIVSHVLVLSDGSVLAWDNLGRRLPEFEGPRDQVLDKLRGALADRCTLERQEGERFVSVSRWQL